jgi:hypothetical protein
MLYMSIPSMIKALDKSGLVNALRYDTLGMFSFRVWWLNGHGCDEGVLRQSVLIICNTQT